MTGDLTLALRTAQSGLLTNQFALNTVADNVANVNTPGYSRRIVNQEENVVAGVGAGVRIAEITRAVDELLIQSLRVDRAKEGGLEAGSATLERLQSLFGTPEDNTSISHTLAGFVAAAESLALTPQGHQERQALVLKGRDIADQLATMTRTIQNLRQQADEDIAREVEVLNAALASIAELNLEIAAASAVTRNSIGLEDQRDRALDTVAGLIDIRTSPRDNGALMVFTTRGQVLVDNTALTITHDPAGTVSATTTHAGGAFNPIQVGTSAANRDVTDRLPAGKLAGLVELRDVLLPALQSSLDELTATFIDTVNAVHNRGTAFPGLASLTGSRVFVDTGAPSSHQLSLDPGPDGGDTVIAVLDTGGDQLAATTLRTVMTAATGLADGPWTVDAIATAVQGWLQGAAPETAAAQVGFDAEGHLSIDLKTASAFLGLRDVDAGGAPADLKIDYDSDGDGIVDETAAGFSAFFGLNDVFTDGRSEAVWESAVIDPGFTLAADTTLTIQDAAGLKPVALLAGDDLATIAGRITNAGVDVSAMVVPDGASQRLRLLSDTHGAIAVTDGSAGFIAAVGLDVAEVGIAAAVGVRSDIVSLPGRIASGALQFDPDRGSSGEYFVSVGDDTTAQRLAATLADPAGFETAGTIKATSLTFVDYAAALIGDVAIRTSTVDRDLGYQRSLVEALQAESDSIRGVNLDEEMSHLILFEQAYNSAARIITVVRDMFDALQNAVG